jgi:hypothetical protein
MLIAAGPEDEVITSVVVAECVRDPLVPVTVSVELPGGVLPVVLIVRVDVPEPVTDVGLNDAVAPAGNPLAPRVTAALNPFRAMTETVQVALPPGAIVCDEGATETEKSAVALTTRVTVEVCVSDPLVPVIVSVELPGGVLPVVVIVRVDAPEPVTDAGLNEAVAPVGKPLALRFTVDVKPFRAPTVTVYVVVPPAVTVWEAGLAPMEKSGDPPVDGTTWTPFRGARGFPVVAPGVAVIVNPELILTPLKRT